IYFAAAHRLGCPAPILEGRKRRFARRNSVCLRNYAGRLPRKQNCRPPVLATPESLIRGIPDVFGGAAVVKGASCIDCASCHSGQRRRGMNRRMLMDAGRLFAGLTAGIASGMFGIGGGVILVPLLGLLLGFSQHRAQGTSLVALIPPTGLLAVIAYAKSDYVSWKVGLLLIPGLFLGGIAGGSLAKMIPAARMRRIFAALIFLLGIWQIFS